MLLLFLTCCWIWVLWKMFIGRFKNLRETFMVHTRKCKSITKLWCRVASLKSHYRTMQTNKPKNTKYVWICFEKQNWWWKFACFVLILLCFYMEYKNLVELVLLFSFSSFFFKQCKNKTKNDNGIMIKAMKRGTYQPCEKAGRWEAFNFGSVFFFQFDSWNDLFFQYCVWIICLIS